MTKDDTFTAGVAFSLLVHLLLVGVLLLKPTKPLKDVPAATEVSIIAPEVLQKLREQIVSPPQNLEMPLDPPPAETQLQSDVNASTVQQSVKRGERGGDTPQQQAQQVVREKSQAKEPVKRTTNPKEAAPEQKLVLKLDGTTAQKLFETQAKTERPRPHSVQPFSRPQGSGAAFLGNGGTRDYLPHLPDGDMTLLNAKANQYAVFVRRVAEQVFSELRTVGWSQLSRSDILAIDQPSRVRAAMNQQGKLVSVEVLGNSGGVRFDAALFSAVKSGTKDANPPSSAALSDGLIHFVFESRSWSTVVSDPRTGGVAERRWLYLGTGLE